MRSNISKQSTSRPIPARSTIAVNKSISSQKQRTVAGTNAADDEGLDKVFTNNTAIAVALLPSVTFRHKETVSKWFAVLMERQLPRQQRNAYLAYLNFQMQNMKISDPFDKDPPTSLTEANQLLKQAKMSSMMAEMESKNVREIMLEGLTPSGMAGFRSAYKPPAEFLADHCTPTNGLVAYGGCFSNHFQ